MVNDRLQEFAAVERICRAVVESVLLPKSDEHWSVIYVTVGDEGCALPCPR